VNEAPYIVTHHHDTYAFTMWLTPKAGHDFPITFVPHPICACPKHKAHCPSYLLSLSSPSSSTSAKSPLCLRTIVRSNPSILRFAQYWLMREPSSQDTNLLTPGVLQLLSIDVINRRRRRRRRTVVINMAIDADVTILRRWNATMTRRRDRDCQEVKAWPSLPSLRRSPM
jgi:hypothetical protein